MATDSLVYRRIGFRAAAVIFEKDTDVILLSQQLLKQVRTCLCSRRVCLRHPGSAWRARRRRTTSCCRAISKAAASHVLRASVHRSSPSLSTRPSAASCARRQQRRRLLLLFLLRLLTSYRPEPYIVRRAVLLLLRVFQHYPQALLTCFKELRALLSHPNQGSSTDRWRRSGRA